MAALFTALLGVSAILLVCSLFDLGEESYIREAEAVIDSEMFHLLERLSALDLRGRLAYLNERQRDARSGPSLFYNIDGDVLAGSYSELPADVFSISEGVVGYHRKVNGDLHRFAAKIHTFKSGHRLLIARDIQAISESYERFKWLSLLILIFMLIVVLISFFISTFVVSRINRIANTAHSIMETGDLSHRISIESRWDDLSNLAYILNRLLARMDALMQSVRDAGQSIAHDLRTPLTRLRTHLEQLKCEARSGRVEPGAIDALIGEADQILGIFNALLRIASLESGKRLKAFQPVNLNQVLLDVLELYEPVAEDKQICLQYDLSHETTDYDVLGDRDLLFQTFANLLDNAIKYTPEHGLVTLAIRRCDQHLKVILTDSGIGVDEAELERLCERFFRSDRSRSTRGSGLGLSLAKAAVDLHGGRLHFSSADDSLSNKTNKTINRRSVGLTVEVVF